MHHEGVVDLVQLISVWSHRFSKTSHLNLVNLSYQSFDCAVFNDSIKSAVDNSQLVWVNDSKHLTKLSVWNFINVRIYKRKNG